ncbi:MFS transporter [Arthrobacter bambusae]|uniref:MFS transporter n=1 Tax=Arthrobacter bambusae TaxID=1338426 RepID=UPI0027837D3E|nr:MFS transporter [Arthrobacter bambusae]MDQ0029940.1 MHS family proline/betaine transporter-like MFS transporter [Arthrobacter bambusae]MDQ0097542.1 MHS family proline/betaine transporter-like MFS transporter [Arthrobacter bambusae]
MTTTTSNQKDSTKAGSLRRVVSSAAVGQFVEWYDFVVYAYTATVLAKLFFPTQDPVAGLLSTFAVYAVGFVMRPVGGILFGHHGDKKGRRNVLSAVILIMGLATVGIGLLPAYSVIGLAAPILLVTCRLVQGLSAGAEAMGSNALVAEHAPATRRGFFVGLSYTFANLPAIFAALLILGLTNTLGSPAYGDWGWRIPFLIGGLISFFGLYIRRRVDESPEFEQASSRDEILKAPAVSVMRHHRKALLFTFVVAALAGLGFYTLTGYFVTFLTTTVKLSSNDALLSNSIAVLIAAVATPIAGAWSDKLGRGLVLIFGAILSAVVAIPAYMLAGTGTLGGAIVGQALLAAALGIFFGPVGIAYLERFPAHVRFSGSALGYNLAYIVFGGTAPLVATWLVATTGNLLSPAIYTSGLAAVVALVLLVFQKKERSIGTTGK